MYDDSAERHLWRGQGILVEMQNVVGIFGSRAVAEHAAAALLEVGVAENAITFLTCECAEPGLRSVPTTDAEAPGMGQALGTYVGGVIGASAGLFLGSAVASLAVPGVGAVFAAGLGAAAALGLGGAAAGHSIGEAAEESMDEGVPRDDVRFYRDLLKQGRSVVIARADSDELATAAHAVMKTHGAEDTDAARRQWQETKPRAA